MDYYFRGSRSIHTYNQAVIDLQKGDIIGAFGLLDTLSGGTKSINQRDYTELYADLLYRNHGDTGEIIRVYRESLSFVYSDRVQAKIDILSQAEISPTQSGQTATGSKDLPKTKTIPDTTSGSEMREKKIQELQKTQSDRKESLDLNAGSTNNASLIDATLQVLDGGQEKKDW